MAFNHAHRLKKSWMEMPVDCFETLTFGELQVGDKFIDLPCPGDNHGHGGLRGTHYIFTKTRAVAIFAGPAGRYAIPTGSATNSRGAQSDLPDSMSVIKIE